MVDTSNKSMEPLQEQQTAAQSVVDSGTVLVCLPSISVEGLQQMQSLLASTFGGHKITIAAPGANSIAGAEAIELVGYPESGGYAGLSLTAADFHTAAELAVEHNAAATLVLGAEAATLSSEALQSLATCVRSGEADLALPRYRLGPHEALLSSALLYPVTRALFSVEAHLPLPLDAAFSVRMAARLRIVSRKPVSDSQDHPLLWPVAEAVLASFAVREVDVGERTLPHPADGDLNSLLAHIAGSLFADVEAKATFWQRARPQTTVKPMQSRSPETTALGASDELQSMAEEFRNAFDNLLEIWSLVLPPQSMLALKKLSRVPAEVFEMPPSLWARIAYDFALAWRLRTINRGHLLGAFTPLYLAWVASHLRLSADDTTLASHHVEQAASAFIAEKSYLVSRWRWPDRFNP